MTIDLNLGASCKTPEVGGIFIDDRNAWASTGFFCVIVEPGKSIPLLFLKDRGCSTQTVAGKIMSVGHIKV